MRPKFTNPDDKLLSKTIAMWENKTDFYSGDGEEGKRASRKVP